MAGTRRATTAVAGKPVSAAAKRAAETEEDYTKYLDREPTDLQERFSDWIVEKVGVEFKTNKEMEAFEIGVRMATSLRMKFQASPENQEVLAANRAKAAEPDDDEPEAKPARKPATRGRAKAAAPVEEPEDEPDDIEDDEADEVEEEEVKPAPRARRTRAATATAKTATTAAKATPAATRRRGTTAKKTGSAAPF